MISLGKMQKLTAFLVIQVGLCWGSLALAADSIGKLGNVLGKAEIVRDGKSLSATKGMEIFATDELITTDKTAVKILFHDGGTFMAFEKASVKISEYQVKTNGKDTNVKSAFDIAKGKVRFFVKPQANGKNDVTIKTANAVMGIRGTSGFIDATDPSKTQLVVLTGKVEVSNPKLPGQTVMVPPNQFTDVVGARPPTGPKPAPINLLSNLNSEASSVDAGTVIPSNSEAKAEKQEEKKAEPSAKEESAAPVKGEKKTVFSPDGGSTVVVDDANLNQVTSSQMGAPSPAAGTVDTNAIVKKTSQATDTNKMLENYVSQTVKTTLTAPKKVNIKVNLPVPPAN